MLLRVLLESRRFCSSIVDPCSNLDLFRDPHSITSCFQILIFLRPEFTHCPSTCYGSLESTKLAFNWSFSESGPSMRVCYKTASMWPPQHFNMRCQHVLYGAEAACAEPQIPPHGFRSTMARHHAAARARIQIRPFGKMPEPVPQKRRSHEACHHAGSRGWTSLGLQ